MLSPSPRKQYMQRMDLICTPTRYQSINQLIFITPNRGKNTKNTHNEIKWWKA